MKVLYTRVSSLDQRSDRQKINESDFDWIIEDKISGSVPMFDRPGGADLKKLVLDGKVSKISIWSIDRSGRSLLDFLQSLSFFTKHKVPVHFISQGLITLDEEGKENPIAKMVISILGVLAEMQRNQIREAQAQGIALAKARKVYKGRANGAIEDTLKFLSKPKHVKAIELLKKGYQGAEISKIVGLSQTTVVKIKKLGIGG